jgi:uncharacterized membrane protein
MTQNKRTVAGILFFIVFIALLTLIRINPTTTTPTRSTQTRTAGIMKGLNNQFIITQEVTALKNYLSGVDLIFTHGGRKNTNENLLLVFDGEFRKLKSISFSSSVVKEGDLTTITFDKPVYLGQGNKYYLSLYSANGTQDNTVLPLFNQSDSIGRLWMSTLNEQDLAGSLKNNKVFDFQGSLMLRTYGSDSSQFWLMKGFLLLLGMMLTGLIIWFDPIRATLARVRIFPEWIFLAIAAPVSLVFALITPPLQVPDEGSHFLKSYDVAEFNLFNKDKTSPVSILKLDSAFLPLHNSAGTKTSFAEIRQFFSDDLKPHLRVSSSPPPYTLPYVPQAIGILTGKIFGASPLMLMYLGRIFNLLISIAIMFFAIRIIPEFKWIFLLLALMPKTLFLFGSLSYDSLTISLSFLTIAVFLHYAFVCDRQLNLKDLGLIAMLMLLLLLCKPPYFILGLLFFFIPPRKFGKLYKYIIIAVGVAVLGVTVLKVVPAVTSYRAATETATRVNQAETGTSEAELPLIRPDEQIRIIMNDIPAYLKLIFESGFDKSRAYILESFVGLLGWIDVELPDLLTYSYLFLIILCGLFLSGSTVNIGTVKKLLLLLMLVAAFIMIETAMYVYATRPGRDQVYGVQGRYFIPMAPLLVMLFYNRFLNPKLNILFSLQRKAYHNAKPKAKPALYQEIVDSEHLFNKWLYLFLVIFCVFTLLFSIYITLVRYYNI